MFDIWAVSGLTCSLGSLPLPQSLLGQSLLAQSILAQEAAPGGSAAGLFQLLPFLAIGILFYLMFIRPDRQRRMEQAQMVENLKKNDRVVTAGGIHGTVVNANKGDKDIVIRVDENSNTRLRIVRTSISRVVDESDSESTSA